MLITITITIIIIISVCRRHCRRDGEAINMNCARQDDTNHAERQPNMHHYVYAYTCLLACFVRCVIDGQSNGCAAELIDRVVFSLRSEREKSALKWQQRWRDQKQNIR